MKNIKEFKKFNEGIVQNISYYSCEECDNIWEEDTSICNCRFCDSDEIEELDSEEYNLLKK